MQKYFRKSRRGNMLGIYIFGFVFVVVGLRVTYLFYSPTSKEGDA